MLAPIESSATSKGISVDLVSARPRKVSPAEAARTLATRDPVIARLVEEAGLPSFPRPTDTHFASLVRSVTYQQLAGAAARAIHGRLVTALDGDVTPERVLATPPEALRAAGLPISWPFSAAQPLTIDNSKKMLRAHYRV